MSTNHRRMWRTETESLEEEEEESEKKRKNKFTWKMARMERGYGRMNIKPPEFFDLRLKVW